MNAVGHDLVGQFVRIFDDKGDHQYQGQILGSPAPTYYLVQLFNKWGEASCAKLARISEMSRWAFYATEDDWREASERNANHGTALSGRREPTPINDVFSRRPESGR